jgi:hypothetical protein
VVQGENPPIILWGKQGENQEVFGDVEKPLVEWIKALPR